MRYDHLTMLPINAFKRLGKHVTYEGGGKGGDVPDAPDYQQLALLQGQMQSDLLNQQTQANRVNQYGPLGSVTWSQAGGQPTFDQAGYDAAMAQYNQQLAQNGGGANRWTFGDNGGSWGFGGSLGQGGNAAASNLVAPDRNAFMRGGGGTGQWSQTTQLSPQMQAILNQNLAAKGQSYDQLQNALGNINNNNLPLAPVNAGETAQDAIMRRINPQLTNQEDALRTRLVNQGLRAGTAGWDREYNLFDQQRNDAYSQAALAGINVGNEARERALAEQAIPINLINAYQSGSQAQMPQFQNYAQQGAAQAPDLLGAGQAQYGAGLNAYNAKQASGANTMGGLFSLGGALASAPSGGLLGSIFNF